MRNRVWITRYLAFSGCLLASMLCFPQGGAARFIPIEKYRARHTKEPCILHIVGRPCLENDAGKPSRSRCLEDSIPFAFPSRTIWFNLRVFTDVDYSWTEMESLPLNSDTSLVVGRMFILDYRDDSIRVEVEFRQMLAADRADRSGRWPKNPEFVGRYWIDRSKVKGIYLNP